MYCQASPTLDLANDCFHFVTKFFEAISASALHIYHSALPLCPRSSVMWGLYGPYANPLVRLVHGTPTLWDLHAATFKCNGEIDDIAWSPCKRFIAVVPSSPGGIQILDAVTLDQLFTTSPIPLQEGTKALGSYKFGSSLFSPNGSLFTYYRKGYIFGWDLQTGGLICSLHLDGITEYPKSMTSSECGTIVGVLFTSIHASVIHICNIVTSANMASYSPKTQSVHLWTHDKRLRFATLEGISITIWEAAFTFEKPPTMIESLSFSCDKSPRSCLFSPSLYNIFSTDAWAYAMDIRNSKYLFPPNITEFDLGWIQAISPDGCFFASISHLYYTIWKQSTTGYTCIQKILLKEATERAWFNLPRFSPDGKLLLVQCQKNAFQLWPIDVSATSFSDFSTQTACQETKDFILEFSSANTLAILTRTEHNVVTVLDLRDSSPRLIINVDAGVYAIRIVGSTAFVLSAGDIFAWGIPTESSGVNHSVRISNSISTSLKDLNILASLKGEKMWAASISPNSHYVAINTDLWHGNSFRDIQNLCLHDATTGNYLYPSVRGVRATWFTPDSSELWAIQDSGNIVGGWKIAKDGALHITKLDPDQFGDLPRGLPWLFTHGYKITEDGWILSSSGKRLLWLPHSWRLGKKEFTMKWSGHYLALLDYTLSEPVILDLCPEELLSD